MSHYCAKLRSWSRKKAMDAVAKYPQLKKQEVWCEEAAYMRWSPPGHASCWCTKCNKEFYEPLPKDPPSTHNLALAEEFTRRVDAGEDMFKVFNDVMARHEASWQPPSLCIHCRSPGGWFCVIQPTLEPRVHIAAPSPSATFYDLLAENPTREQLLSKILAPRVQRCFQRGRE